MKDCPSDHLCEHENFIYLHKTHLYKSPKVKLRIKFTLTHSSKYLLMTKVSLIDEYTVDLKLKLVPSQIAKIFRISDQEYISVFPQ